MFTIRSVFAAVLAVALLGGCDPFSGENKNAATITKVLGITVVEEGESNQNPVPATPPATSGAPWTLAGTAAAQSNGVWVQTNGFLDGTTVQATPADCTPTAGAFTFGGTAPTGTWYACYIPNSANPAESGGSILFFAGADPADPVSGSLPAGPFTIRGNVRDRQGNTLQIAVDVTP